ncbi:MAG: RloB family protein [Succinivibrio sp.]|nr:RloB family protein [Succinivibrio sp.]
MLHHKFTTAPCYSSKDPVQKVINQLKEFDPSYSKADSQDFSEYYELTDKAILNATKVLDEANNNGTDDPSTHIHELVILLKDLASKINS